MPPTLGSSSTILVVDNEPAVLNRVKFILEAAGYAVMTACNSQQALAFCEKQDHAIDLLLTDMNMPDTGGPKLACQISEITPRLSVIFMSSRRAHSPDIEVLRSSGPFSDCEVISKPFTSRELLEKVDRACCQQRCLEHGWQAAR